MQRLLAQLLLIAALLAGCKNDVIVPDGPPVDGYDQPAHLEITTDDLKEITSKGEYTDATFSLTGVPEKEQFTVRGRIRGRGNATWTYEKKPYRINLDEKRSIGGLPADRDWTLLAEYTDKSLLRNTYLYELARMAGVPYPVRYRHIEVTLNGEYLGIYLLAECIERSGHRIDIGEEGFIIENDNYWADEPLHFYVRHTGYYTFKYPDADREEITRIDDNYKYIKKFMESLDEALYGKDFTNPELGYRAYIDVKSFARWYLVNELLGNYDPNYYYVLPHKGAKLQMGPCWDGEWCLGLAARQQHGLGWAEPPATSPLDIELWRNEKFFARLFQDPYFLSEVRSEWAAIKPKLPGFKAIIREIAESIAEAQERNFERWPLLDEYVSVGLVALGSWEAETTYAADFFDRRVAWFDNYIAQEATLPLPASL